MKKISRRGFAGALAIAPFTGKMVNTENQRTEPDSVQSIDLCIFSKHLQWLDFQEMAETAASIGFDGIDLTVRPGGHVEPERVRQDLPRAARAVRAAGLKLPMMTTSIQRVEEPFTRDVLSVASDHRIRFYRMGYYRYSNDVPVVQTLNRASRNLEELSNLNREFKLTGDYQNHAGQNYFGASLWDLWHCSQKTDPKDIGVQFDLRHASVEGALNWPLDFRLLQDRIHTLVVKDYKWEKTSGRYHLVNCPLGEGMTDFPRLFSMCKKLGWKGPITLHLEYPLGGANHGARSLDCAPEVVINAIKRDLGVLKYWLKTAE